jgi:hypothetical protein
MCARYSPRITSGCAASSGGTEVYGGTEASSDLAAAQFYAARKLVEAGRRAEADLFLHPALSFYRSVGAAQRVQQGEALLAATA